MDSLDVLKGRTWDACIDTCAYVPRAVRIAAGVLSGNVNRYLLISTISVYKDPVAGSDEDAPMIEEGDPSNEVVDSESYGFLKVLCEREVVASFGPEALLIRPGIVIGPHDPTDRFTYWVARIGSEAKVISPAGPDRPVQWIDARDLGTFALHALEGGLTGPYNVVGEPTTLRGVLGTIRSELNPSCEFVELDMESHSIAPWTDLPLVVDPGYGTFQLSIKKAAASGLSTRTLSASVGDTDAWWREQGRDLKTGLSWERHSELLTGTATA